MKKEAYNYPDVVITAGGTREKIDDVRYIGNFSGGRLGHALAETYAQMGRRVLLLAPNEVPSRFGLPEGVEHQSFTSAASLDRAVRAIPAARLVFHAAAVSDYTPIRTHGKISSDKDELTIQLKRTPKILPKLRDHFGADTKIVGFKLLSGVSEGKLIDTAVDQVNQNHTDWCVANDLQDLKKETRKLYIVRPDLRLTVEGSAQTAAHQIAELIKPKERSHVGT